MRNGGSGIEGVQADQHIDGKRVELILGVLLPQQPAESIVAEVLKQQEPLRLVGGEDGGCAEAEAAQVAGDADERAHVLPLRRRIHQHRPRAIVAQPMIVAEGRIAGEWRDRGPAPAGAGEECAYGCAAIRQRQPPLGERGSRRRVRSR